MSWRSATSWSPARNGGPTGREKSGAAWDYVFRRLFYARTADAGREDFATPVEIDSVDDTGGHIANLDLWLDPRGAAHLLYLKTNISPILRDRFFPGRSIATNLEHVVVERGRVVERSELAATGDRWGGLHHARFHAMADGRSWSFLDHASGLAGKARLENRVLRLPADRAETGALIDLKGPFTTFFTATERGGNRPDHRSLISSAPGGQRLGDPKESPGSGSRPRGDDHRSVGR